MTNRPAATLPKWPFIFADVALLVACGWVITQALPAKVYFVVAIAVLGWMFGAWICIMPWLKEFQAQVKQDENDALASAIEQIQKLEEVGSRVQAASATWQSAQDAAVRVTAAAREIEEKIRADSKDFMEFAERINNDEKQHLRLEVEKLRRNEGEWLQVAARILDHTFAVTTAAMRSGQPNLSAQMTNFQTACRDAARRVGLLPFHPAVGDAFDDRSHQLEDANAKPEEGAVISDILATGYTFQGQLLRKALVRVSKPEEPQASQPAPEPHAAEPEPAPAPEMVEEQVAVAEQAEETHEQSVHPEQTQQSEQSTDQWERLEQSFEERVAEEEAPSPQPSPAREEEETSERAESEGSFENNDRAESSPSPLAGAGRGEGTVEASDAATPAEDQPTDDKPRRRQRKPDPQTSLPF